MKTHRTDFHGSCNPVRTAAALVAVAGAFALPGMASGQDWNAMLEQQNAAGRAYIQQQQAQMDAGIAAANQQVAQIVQQKMQDPQVQAAYREHQAQAAQSGMQPYDFPTFAYYYVATRGFSSDGMAAYRSGEQANQARERQAYDGLREAQAQRQAAMNEQQESYYRNQQEAGRQLMGNSTYVNPADGQTQALPHTWQRNTYNNHQGQTYYVDQSGVYWMADPNNSGYWYPLEPGR
ncbi:MAG: hypothetical protein H0W33_00245 [Gammaproteobacteria bacterium]|nr:hypothetical protein [Gammaproteobacteria bacterium]